MDAEIRSALLRTLPFVIVIFVVVLLKLRRNVKVQDLDLKKPSSFTPFLFWVIGFLLYCLFVEFSLFSLNILDVSSWNHTLNPSIILISGAIIFAPIAEEILFRGFILNLLLRKIANLHLAILMQAFLFVLLHNFAYQNTLSSNIGIAQSLVDAVLFAYARKYTKSLLTPIAMHMVGNSIAIIERFMF